MATTKPLSTKKNLLLCLDAFGTLFTPSIPIPVAYARAAARHGIEDIGNTEDPREIASRFKRSFRGESKKNPNYGKATQMTVEKWWGNVIHSTFAPMLKPTQRFPQGLVTELIRTYSSSEGYSLYPDVKPFFNMLRSVKSDSESQSQISTSTWPWDKTIVGIITNSDSRVPSILSSFDLHVSARRHKARTSTALMEAETADINFVIMSYDVGAEKPDAAIFRAAEEMLGDDIQEFEKLYVGDDIEKDYFGAKYAGWGSLLVRRGVRKLNEEGESSKGIIQITEKNELGKRRRVDAVESLLDLGSWQPKQKT
ncbi:haloacid dehalogenase [Pyrenophora seminiperda CCB06]|uniref:Haloacid dehalogenase n=1 Tax=Pyrenophora seminiperda CCB06 TaxID=1302712 RepID=A0A3M7MAJ2_9PLEO|nr:haloacid dehalogenase [Pyrenophora seminiperda CCB06]